MTAEKPLRFMRDGEVRAKTSLTETVRDRLEQAGQFPARVKLSERTVGWAEHEIDQWMLDRIAERDARVGAK
jgi:prophage regulatory protein